MKVVCAMVLIFALAGCTQARYRSQECDSFFYGQYQAMGEPKAMAVAIPSADPQTSTRYDTRCWARAAASRPPPDMSAVDAMNELVSGVLRDCNQYKNDHNSRHKALDLDCRIVAKNMVWEPWVNELRTLDAMAMGVSSESMTAPAAATGAAATASAASGADYQSAAERPVPNFAPPPVSAISTTTSPGWETSAQSDEPIKLYGFHDAFNWCPSPGNWCNNDRLIGIKHPRTGQLIGRLAIYIRPHEASGNQLDYTLQLNNESYCTMVLEGLEITQDGQVIGTWKTPEPALPPAGSLTIAETVTFRDGASSNAVVSVSGLARDCQD